MVRILAGAAGRPNGAALMGLMRESGSFDGEGREVKGSARRVHAKSGTLNFVSGLAGYIGAPGAIFAIFAADVARRAAVPMEEREDPPGGGAWNKRARKMQRQLISVWAARL
jgi:D-alanyl-D-alanine carboxypeptidase/D-alanyl-D-alanine-endopeptidase (penicillin-binding protein 4)